MQRDNILVTGGFGLLGKPLISKLIENKSNVFILEKKKQIEKFILKKNQKK